MRSRYRWFRWMGVATLVAGLALIAAGCGSSGKKTESTTTASTTTSQTGGTAAQRPFDNFRIVYDTGLDFLDPGLSYTTQGRGLMWNVLPQPAGVQAS